MCAKFGTPNLPQSSDITQNSDGGISVFQISCQSLIKVNYHNSRTSEDIEMKLGTVTKIDKRNKTTAKKIDDDVTVIFLIYGLFLGIRKLVSGCIV